MHHLGGSNSMTQNVQVASNSDLFNKQVIYAVSVYSNDAWKGEKENTKKYVYDGQKLRYASLVNKRTAE